MLDVNNVCDIMEMRETSIFVWMGHPGSSQGINLDTQSQYLWHERIFRKQKLIKLTKNEKIEKRNSAPNKKCKKPNPWNSSGPITIYLWSARVRKRCQRFPFLGPDPLQLPWIIIYTATACSVCNSWYTAEQELMTQLGATLVPRST